MNTTNEQLQAPELMQPKSFVPPPPSGYVTLLAREFDVDVRTVTNALQGKTLSRKAMQIRKAYMDKYIQPYLNHNTSTEGA